MVGDGSYDDTLGLGAGARIVSSADGSEYIITGGPTPGTRSTQSPYRSKVGTIVSMGILAHVLSQLTQTSSTVVVSCDNNLALERPFCSKRQLSAKHHSADLVTLAHDLWHSSKMKAIPTRVKGHADEHSNELSLLETLNCIVDNKAKDFLSRRSGQEVCRPRTSTAGLAHISWKGIDV